MAAILRRSELCMYEYTLQLRCIRTRRASGGCETISFIARSMSWSFRYTFGLRLQPRNAGGVSAAQAGRCHAMCQRTAPGPHY